MEKSKQLYDRAVKSVPYGVHSNSRYRVPHPIYFKSGKGAYLYDVDGNEYIDLNCGNGAVMLGHGNEEFNRRFNENLQSCSGLTTGSETELAVKAAEVFRKIFPVDKVRFTNSGTEAITHVMHMARAYTGKNDFALVEGAYNGWSDYVNISNFPSLSEVGDAKRPNAVPGSGGLDKKAIDSSLVIPFNDLEASRILLTENKDRIAALILEPVMIDIGFVESEKGYLQGLRTICDELGILLVFDELLTGFRVPDGSCQKHFGIVPDLSIFGKAIANGHILAAVAGKEDVMNIAAPIGGKTGYVGTFNGHVYSMAAGLAAMEMLLDGTVRETLDKRTLYLKSEFEKSAKKYGITAIMNGRGGHLQWYFTDSVQNYRDAAGSNTSNYVNFANAMLEQGILVVPKPLSHHAITLGHDDEVIEKLVVAMDNALKAAAEKIK
ncbi:MAG TPA: aspartate aminotransferase family protein [Clostridia bacterium]|nr:aspartate aminotransferase family protein [Clostridia bacterium]